MSLQELPQGYEQIFSIDLQKDKKEALKVNVLALIIGVLLAVPMHFVVSIGSLFDMDDGLGIYALKFVAIFVLVFVYMVVHELVHGVAMKICKTKKVKYGFTGMYAFAGSDDYYSKKHYIFIALAPVVLLGVIIAIVNAFVCDQWFWVVYFLQITNISGAAGDLYVTVLFSRMPKDILIRDHGVGMTVFSKTIS